MASHSIYFILALCTSACTISACTDPRQHDNQLTDQERKDGWTLLFDGGSTGVSPCRTGPMEFLLRI